MPRPFFLSLFVVALFALCTRTSTISIMGFKFDVGVDVRTNVCNMSLSSEGDNGPVQVKCHCNLLTFDVDCGDLGITELPAAISFPKNIHVANFRGNHIEDVKDDTFYNGREIMELDLSNNHIDFISVEAFKAFKKLMRLNLSHNRIWNLPVRAFDGLTDIRVLDLSFNDMISIIPELFQDLLELRELKLESNPLMELEPNLFEHLSKLEYLNLEATMLQVIPDHLFSFTPSLKMLNLASNQMKEIPTAAIQVLNKLKILDLSGNPIDIVQPQAFLGLEGLVILYLDRMPHLVKIEKFAFGDLKRIREIHCSYNFYLSHIEETAFVCKKTREKISISQLFLRQNNLKSLSSNLQDWSQSMELHIRDNPLDCDCNARWLADTNLKNRFQDHVWCASPSHLQGHLLSGLKGDDLTCGLSVTDIIILSSGVISAILIMLLIVAFVVWRRNYGGYSKPYFRVSKRTNVDDIEYEKGY